MPHFTGDELAMLRVMASSRGSFPRNVFKRKFSMAGMARVIHEHRKKDNRRATAPSKQAVHKALRAGRTKKQKTKKPEKRGRPRITTRRQDANLVRVLEKADL